MVRKHLDRCNPAARQGIVVAPQNESIVRMKVDLAAVVEQTGKLVGLGQHVEALDASDACITALAAAASGDQCRLALQLHSLRAFSQSQLGSLKRALAEYSAALQHAQMSDEEDTSTVCKILLARSALHEQEEQWSAALADASEAARLQQPPSAQAMLAVHRLRKVCHRAGIPY